MNHPQDNTKVGSGGVCGKHGAWSGLRCGGCFPNDANGRTPNPARASTPKDSKGVLKERIDEVFDFFIGAVSNHPDTSNYIGEEDDQTVWVAKQKLLEVFEQELSARVVGSRNPTHTNQVLTELLKETKKLKKRGRQPKLPIAKNTHKQGWNDALSECQRVIEGRLK